MGVGTILRQEAVFWLKTALPDPRTAVPQTLAPDTDTRNLLRVGARLNIELAKRGSFAICQVDSSLSSTEPYRIDPSGGIVTVFFSPAGLVELCAQLERGEDPLSGLVETVLDAATQRKRS